MSEPKLRYSIFAMAKANGTEYTLPTCRCCSERFFDHCSGTFIHFRRYILVLGGAKCDTRIPRTCQRSRNYIFSGESGEQSRTITREPGPSPSIKGPTNSYPQLLFRLLRVLISWIQRLVELVRRLSSYRKIELIVKGERKVETCQGSIFDRCLRV